MHADSSAATPSIGRMLHHVIELIRWWWSSAVLRSSMQDKLKILKTKKRMFIGFHRIRGFVSYSTPYVSSLVPMCCACASSEPIFDAACWMKSKLFSERFVWIPPSFSKFPFFPQPLSWPVGGLRDHKLPNTTPSYSVHICPAEYAIGNAQTVHADLSAVSIYRGTPYKLEPSLSICCNVIGR